MKLSSADATAVKFLDGGYPDRALLVVFGPRIIRAAILLIVVAKTAPAFPWAARLGASALIALP